MRAAYSGARAACSGVRALGVATAWGPCVTRRGGEGGVGTVSSGVGTVSSGVQRCVRAPQSGCVQRREGSFHRFTQLISLKAGLHA